jgi:hypothetical protein
VAVAVLGNALWAVLRRIHVSASARGVPHPTRIRRLQRRGPGAGGAGPLVAARARRSARCCWRSCAAATWRCRLS